MDPWSLAEQRAREGMELIERGHAQRSIEHLRRGAGLLKAAIEIVPTDPAWHAALGEALAAMGDLPGAGKAFAEAASIEPGERAHALRLAHVQVRSGEVAQGLETLDALLKEDSAFEPAYCLRIEALGRLNRFDEAEETFYLARQHTEHCVRCDIAITRCLLAQGDSKRAIAILQRLEAEGATGLHLAYGQAHLNDGKFDAAITSLTKATQEDPADPAGWLGLGVALEASGKFAPAGDALHKAEKLAPNVAQVQATLARWEMSRGNYKPAAKHARRALKLNPDEVAMNLLLARVSLERGHTHRARKHLAVERKTLATLPMPIAFELATMLGEVGLPVAARKTWRQLTKLFPGAPAIWQNLAVAAFAAGRFEAGERATQKSLNLDPRRPEPYYNIALAHARAGRFDLALTWTDSGLHVAPDDESLRLLRRRTRLQSFWRKAQRLLPRRNP